MIKANWASVKYFSNKKLVLGKTKFYRFSRSEKPIRKYLRKYQPSIVARNINAVFLSLEKEKIITVKEFIQ